MLLNAWISRALLGLIYISYVLADDTPATFDILDAQSPEVEFGDRDREYQPITFDENNDNNKVVNLVLLKILDSNKNEKFSISCRSSSVCNDDLHLVTSKISESDDYYLTGHSLDYEKMPTVTYVDIKYMNYVLTLIITLKNLNDEPPQVTMDKCSMKEITQKESCPITILDPDGWINLMKFDVSQDPNDMDDKRPVSEWFEIGDLSNTNENSKSAVGTLSLKADKELDYETHIVHNLVLHVYDEDNQDPELAVTISVVDMPDEDPIWTTYMFTMKIPEESIFTFQIAARDGDFGINNPIEYAIEQNDYATIDKESGIITVIAIDRDQTPPLEQVKFMVQAIDKEDNTSFTNETVTLIIEDIDDNIPKITTDSSIAINTDEGDATNIENYEINVNDIDTGENAMYNIEIISNKPDIQNNFNVVPTKGYESIQLSIIVKNAKLLDYENEEWRNIQFTIRSTGTKNSTFMDEVEINIELEDVNDEYPEFELLSYEVNVRENLPKNGLVANIQATDKDAEDANLAHEILGLLSSSLTIEEYGGKITTDKDNVFDYERQTEEYIQIKATDKVGHASTVQLTIHVLDVNDEPPTFGLIPQIIIEENQSDGNIVEGVITATDKDTKPDLEFSIVWEESYALKNLKTVDVPQFLIIKKRESDDKQFAEADLVIVGNDTPDFEEFDTVYLTLKVEDKNTEEGKNYTTANIGIRIENLNDNPPVFTPTTKITNYTVLENTASDSLIGMISATDADNLSPLIYSISDEDSQLLEINPSTGELKTGTQQIDCDVPPRFTIDCDVIVNDTEFTDTFNLKLFILDQNDNSPELSGTEKNIEEDFYGKPSTQNGIEVFDFNVIDNDRDDSFNAETVECLMLSNNDQYLDTFTVNKKKLTVDLKNSKTLDRELIASYNINIQCTDNPDGIGVIRHSIENPPQFTINLDDLNDWTPTILNADVTITTGENTEKDTKIDQKIKAEDKDLENNGKVKFSIENIRCSTEEGNTCLNPDNEIADMFLAFNSLTDTNTMQLQANKNLKTFYGIYEIDLKVEDQGHTPLSSTGTIKVEIQKFNFESPIFTSPDSSKTYYLDTEQQQQSPLVQSTGGTFPDIKADDNQNGKFKFKYTIEPNELIDIQSKDNSIGTLLWKGNPLNNKKEFQITITATIEDGSNLSNEKPYNVTETFNLYFFSLENSEPYFEVYTGTFEPKENDDSLTFQIPKATYQGVDDLHLDVYYFLKDQKETFNLQTTSGLLSLNHTLDYETQTKYELTIYASSNKDGVKDNPEEESTFNLIVLVQDENDCPPEFASEQYYATVTVGSTSKTQVIKLEATDKDTVGSKITYSITSYNNPANVAKDIAYFDIDKDSGQISVISLITESMTGFFTLSVSATDEPPEENEGTTNVKIHIVTKENTVNFKFENPLAVVSSKLSIIEAILNAKFGYTTHAEFPTSENTKDTASAKTLVPIYFIDETHNEPILATEILKEITSASTFTELRQLFVDESLILLSFETTSEEITNDAEFFKTWLIGVSVVLGGFLVVLLVAFILKLRSLTNRIKNLTSPKFGSQESGLNRVGLAIPTANRNAVEGANPVYNNNKEEVKEIDQNSIASGDSDLIGVEDNPEFDMKNTHEDDISDDFPHELN